MCDTVLTRCANILTETRRAMWRRAKKLVPVFCLRHPIGLPANNHHRVLIAGGYGYGNTGDEAQLAANIAHWRRKWPGAQVVVLSPDPAYTKRTHHVVSLPASRVVFFDSDKNSDYNISNEGFKRRFLRMKPRLLFAARLLAGGLPVVGVSREEARFLLLLKSATVMHLSGGGYLTGMTLSRLWDHMLLIGLCEILGTPVILSGHTVGVFKDQTSRQLAKWGLEKARRITVRDRDASLNELHDIGVRGPHVTEAFDDALFSPQITADETGIVLEKAGVDPAKPYVAAHVHSWGQSVKTQALVSRRFAELCDYLISKHKCQVLFVPMISSDETTEKQCLRNMVQRAAFLDYDYDHRVVRAVIGHSSFCLTMKHHPIVFALGNGTPAISISLDAYYQHKNAGALGLCGMEHFALNSAQFLGADAERIIDTFLASSASIRRRIRDWLTVCREHDGEVVSCFLRDNRIRVNP